jgi:hypothetical protein
MRPLACAAFERYTLVNVRVSADSRSDGSPPRSRGRRHARTRAGRSRDRVDRRSISHASTPGTSSIRWRLVHREAAFATALAPVERRRPVGEGRSELAPSFRLARPGAAASRRTDESMRGRSRNAGRKTRRPGRDDLAPGRPRILRRRARASRCFDRLGRAHQPSRRVRCGRPMWATPGDAEHMFDPSPNGIAATERDQRLRGHRPVVGEMPRVLGPVGERRASASSSTSCSAGPGCATGLAGLASWYGSARQPSIPRTPSVVLRTSVRRLTREGRVFIAREFSTVRGGRPREPHAPTISDLAVGARGTETPLSKKRPTLL